MCYISSVDILVCPLCPVIHLTNAELITQLLFCNLPGIWAMWCAIAAISLLPRPCSFDISMSKVSQNFRFCAGRVQW